MKIQVNIPKYKRLDEQPIYQNKQQEGINT